MRSLLSVSLCCISLFHLHQLQAFPVGNQRSRSNSIVMVPNFGEGNDITPDSDPTQAGPTDVKSVAPVSRTALWRALLLKHPPPSSAGPTQESDSIPMLLERPSGAGKEVPRLRGTRGRRHAGLRAHHHLHHDKLMRVGCKLGTCQVQNLSHRLHQLIGQSGREDSPVNPHSPHSYG